jgi:hypothetical protein
VGHQHRLILYWQQASNLQAHTSFSKDAWCSLCLQTNWLPIVFLAFGHCAGVALLACSTVLLCFLNCYTISHADYVSISHHPNSLHFFSLICFPFLIAHVKLALCLYADCRRALHTKAKASGQDTGRNAGRHATRTVTQAPASR